MIPIFPKFESLHFNHKEEIEKFASIYPPFSDYNFASLWSYDTKNELKVSFLNKNLVIKFNDYITTKPFFSFLGTNKFVETCQNLLTFEKIKKNPIKLKLIPEIFDKKLIVNKLNLLKIKEDIDNHDYIFSLDNLSKMIGKDYEKKRWRFNKFSKIYPYHYVKLLDLSDNITLNKIKKLFNIWEKFKEKKPNEVKNEWLALLKLIKKSKYFNLISVGIYFKNDLIAFSINERLINKFAIGHFSKTNQSYQGIYEAIFKYSADELLKNNCELFNLEQDMGEENLRIAKYSWRPKYFLKKYSIELK